MIIGSHGEMKANGSVIVARNHIHMRPQDAEEYGVHDGDKVRVEVESDRKVIFEDVPIRVSEKFAPAMHIDFDEANACGYRVGTEAFILYGAPSENRGVSAVDMEQLINEVVKNVCAVLNEEPISDIGCKDDIIREKLVTEQLAKALIHDCTCGTLCFAKGTIITPAARDIFKAGHKKIEIL